MSNRMKWWSDPKGQTSTSLWHHIILPKPFSDHYSTSLHRNRRGECDHISHLVELLTLFLDVHLETVVTFGLKMCVKHLFFRICSFSVATSNIWSIVYCHSCNFVFWISFISQACERIQRKNTKYLLFNSFKVFTANITLSLDRHAPMKWYL